MNTKKDDHDHKPKEKEAKLTTEMVIEALVVHAYLTSATTGDPIAEEHARTASAQADEVIRRVARQAMKLNGTSNS